MFTPFTQSPSPLSVDFEWVATFRKGGNTRPVSLVQLADKNTILLIQLRNANTTMSRFPRALQRLLEDPTIPKAGANILSSSFVYWRLHLPIKRPAGDAKKLFRDYGVMMAGVVELGALARQADPACAIPTVFGGGKKLVSLAKVLILRCTMHYNKALSSSLSATCTKACARTRTCASAIGKIPT